VRLRQPTIEDLLVAPTREGDPSTSFEAAGRVKVKEKQRLTLEALLELRRHNAAPVEACSPTCVAAWKESTSNER